MSHDLLTIYSCNTHDDSPQNMLNFFPFSGFSKVICVLHDILLHYITPEQRDNINTIMSVDLPIQIPKKV